MVNFRDTYDVTPRERAVIEDRDARRKQLRNEYLKKYLNPFKPEGGTMFDAPIQRLMSLRATRKEYCKPTFMSWLWHTAVVILPILLLSAAVKKERGILEHQYRTGQIAYKDRHNKFT